MSVTPEGAPYRPAYIRDASGLYYRVGGGGGGGAGGGLDQTTADGLYVGKTVGGTQTMLAQLTTPQVNLGTGGNVRTTGTMLEVTGDEGIDFYVNSGGMNFWSADHLTMDAQAININSGKLTVKYSSTVAAGLRIPHGSAPTTPSDGDLWTTTAGMYARINGATVGPLGAGGGGGLDQATADGLYLNITGDALTGGDLTLFRAPTADLHASTKKYVDDKAATTTPAAVNALTPQIGVSVTYARSDHKHDISTGTPVALGVANATGSSTSMSRSDHVHIFPTKTDIGLGSVDNTSDAAKPVSTATTTALNLKANLASPTFTGTPLSTTAAVDTNTTQIATTAYVIGQGYLKTATATSTYQPLDTDLTTLAGLTATTGNMILSVGSAWASQTPAQVKTALALNNVDNTTDANKPVSTATTTALNLKANLAGPTFTGVPAAPTATLGTNTTQLATTAFVLANAGAVPDAFKQPVICVSTTNITLSGTQVVDGLTIDSAGGPTRVLVAGQTTVSQNGVYTSSTGAWTRATDMDASGELSKGVVVPVSAGTAYARTYWACTSVTTAPDTPWAPGNNNTWAPAPYGMVKDEGALLQARSYLDFAGTGVTVTDDSAGNRTLVTIPGGGGLDQATADTLYIGKTGVQTMTGNLTIDASGTASIIIDRGATSNYAQFEFRTAGVQKWTAGTRNGEGEDWTLFGSSLRALRFDATTALGVVVGDPTAALGIATKQYADTRVLKAGDTMSGALSIDNGLNLNAAFGTGRSMSFQTGWATRWAMGKDTLDDFTIGRYNDGGGWVANAIAIARATGAVTVATTLTATDIGANTVQAYMAPTAAADLTRKDYVDARTPKVTVASTAPSSPATNDLWVDTT